MKKINTMEKEFIPYELELKLKYLGCDKFINYTTYDPYPTENRGILYQQALDWFRAEYGLYSNIVPNPKSYVKYNNSDWLFGYNIIDDTNPMFDLRYKTYEEARLACLNKLIELVEREYETD